MNTEKEKDVIVLNTPKNLNLQEELNRLASNSDYYKPLEDSRANYNKLVFLIHQINYWTKVDNVKKGYELNNQNHYQMMGLSPNHLKMLIDALIALGLVKLIKRASKDNKSSNCYAYINPFNINDENIVNKHFFNVEEAKCPKFIKKWVKDGNKVLGKERSSYKESDSKVEKKSKPNIEVEALKLEVERLKELLKINNIQFDEISPLETLKAKDDVVVAGGEKVPVKSAYDEKTDAYIVNANGRLYTFNNYSIMTKKVQVEKREGAIQKIIDNECKDYVVAGVAVHFLKTETPTKVDVKFLY